MKKALLFLLGLVLVSPAFASVRTDGMGILPIQDEDIDLIWVFPQAAADYSVVDYRLDYNGSGDNWGGIIHTDKYLGNYGLYIGRPFQATSYTGLDYIDGVYGGSIFNGIGDWRTRLSWGNDHTPYNTMNWWGSSIGADYTIGQYYYENRMPENKFDFFTTRKMGGGVLGLRINLAGEKNYGKYSYDDTQYGAGNTSSYGTRVLNFTLGFGKKNVGPFNAFDLSLGYGMASGKDELVYTTFNVNEYTPSYWETVELDGTHEMTVNLRGVKDVSDSTKMITNLEYMSNKLGLIFTTESDPDLDGVTGEAAFSTIYSDAYVSSSKIALGHNCVHKVHDGVAKVVAGMNIQYNKAKWNHNERYNLANSDVADQIWGGDYSGQETTKSFFGLWSNIGVEANVLKWLTFRGGISKALLGASKETWIYPYDYTGTDNAPNETETYKYSWNETAPVMTTFGAGVVYKNWNVDLLYSAGTIEDMLHNPSLGDGVAYGGTLLGISAAKVELRYNL